MENIMEEKLTEVQIEERVNGWIEKMIKYTQHQINIGELPKRFGEKIMIPDYQLINSFKKELRKNPAWVPVKRVHYYGVGICWEPEDFLGWEE
jgi:hypothetical protein